MGQNRRRKAARPPRRDDNTSPLPLPKSSLYLLYKHTHGPSSLYKINLQDGVPATNLLPTLKDFELYDPDKYRTRMACALLGSKLYYLGGQLRIDADADHLPDYDQIFPRHVYEFDTTSDGPLKKMEAASLNTGKPGPCVFAAEGKIYALGSRMTDQNLPGPLARMLSVLTKELQLFESFNLITKQCQQLPDPPVHDLVRWTGCNVLEHRKLVVISAQEFHKRCATVLVYDLHQKSWKYYDDPSYSKIMTALSLQEGGSNVHLYGLPPNRAPVKTELDFKLDTILCKSNSQAEGFYYGNDDDDGLVEMSDPGKGKRQLADMFIDRHYVDYYGTAKRFLCYLGDGHFCYIDSGLLSRSDLYTRGISVTLFKDISDDDGNTSTKSGGDYFKAKILYSRKNVLKAPLVKSLATLEKCFVV